MTSLIATMTTEDRVELVRKEIDSARLRHEARKAARDEIVKLAEEIEGRSNEAGHRVKVLDYVGELLKVVAEKREAKFREGLEALVTQALRAVFDDDSYTFFIEQDVKRDQATARLMLERVDENDELFRTPIKGYHGGGVIDIVAFVLNAIVLTLVKPRRRRTLWLDEPFPQVSKAHRPRVAEMLKWLHEETGLQFIIVTHEDEYISVADTVFRVTQTNGKTKVRTSHKD